jgi:hypothetical protein
VPDVVADDRDAGILEALRPFGVGGDEDRNVVDEGDAGFQRAFGVESVASWLPTGR